MTPPDKHDPNDPQLMQYLLGTLPAAEAERLDELSITNDDFSWRLRATENELVDAYVRSELNGDTLRRFHTFYLSSPKRRDKVAFAEGLFRFQADAAKEANQSSDVGSFFSRLFTPRRIVFQFAGAAFVMLFIAGYLLFDNMRLRNDMSNAQAVESSIRQNTQELEKELQQQRAANADSQKKLEPASTESPDLNKLDTLALLLPPPSRGLSSIKTITVHPNADLVVLLLALESAEYPHYRVTLKDPATDTAVWRSAEVEPTAAGDKPGVSVSFRTNLLKTQNYVAEVAGISKSGKAEVVGDYAFHVVVK
jgi:hypothetical protein